jgi:hypothetical protein
MQVVINVDDAMFKEIAENEINALPKEKIQELIFAAIEKLLNNDSMVKNLFVTQQTNHWGTKETYPSELMKLAASKFDISPAFKEIETKMIETLKNNYNGILIQALSQSVLRGMFQSEPFQEAVRYVFYDIKRMEQNQN